MPLTFLRNKVFTPPKEPLVKLAMPLDAKIQSKLATVNIPKKKQEMNCFQGSGLKMVDARKELNSLLNICQCLENCFILPSNDLSTGILPFACACCSVRQEIVFLVKAYGALCVT